MHAGLIERLEWHQTMGMSDFPNSSLLSTSRWLLLLPLAYALHAIDEYRGVGVLHGINLSSKAFLVFSGAAWLLMLLGIAISKKYRFQQLLGVCLGTAFLLNGFSHVLNSIVIKGYDAGVISGTVLFIPLGTAILVWTRNKMSRSRYCVGLALGIVIQVIAMIVAL